MMTKSILSRFTKRLKSVVDSPDFKLWQLRERSCP